MMMVVVVVVIVVIVVIVVVIPEASSNYKITQGLFVIPVHRMSVIFLRSVKPKVGQFVK